nr:glycoside hydrolase family 15 protein [Nitrospirales bacterium]
MNIWKSLERIDGYLPIEDHGLIGDGATAALVGRDGGLSWLCVPRFDSPPLFCSLLDAARGGGFTVTPEGLLESRQFYEPDTAVLVTEMRSRSGVLRLTDFCPLIAGANLSDHLPATRNEIVRSVKVLEGSVRLLIHIEPRGGGELVLDGEWVRIKWNLQPYCCLYLGSTIPLKGSNTSVTLKKEQSVHFLLSWRRSHVQPSHLEPIRLYEDTVAVWLNWLRNLKYRGPQESLVRRSAITIKLLDHLENGAIVAAPTSSLPELIGGPRNWDYRYAWVRDAAFSVYALHRVGLSHEAAGFLGWVLDAVERDGRPKVMYDLDGRMPLKEWEDAELEGYRRSRPVRWGNAAAAQHQHDVYGEILDCAYQWAAHHGNIPDRLWNHLRKLSDVAADKWREPDHGIWEVRTSGRPFTYSAALCHVAVDRAARMAERFRLPGPYEHWKRKADEIGQAIL